METWHTTSASTRSPYKPEEGEAISDSGKFVTIWKRENGSWKVDVDIFNSSLPLPAPEALPTAEGEE